MVSQVFEVPVCLTAQVELTPGAHLLKAACCPRGLRERFAGQQEQQQADDVTLSLFRLTGGQSRIQAARLFYQLCGEVHQICGKLDACMSAAGP